MLTKQEFASFRNEVEKALEIVSKKYNVDIKAGKINYTDIDFKMQLQVNKKEINGASYEQIEFEQYCTWYGFTKDDYNKHFIYGGKKYNIIGFKPKASKFPVLAKCEDGKTYKMTSEIVKTLISA